MDEKLATPQQIRKLYAVLRNRGLDPKEHVTKLKEEKGIASLNRFTKRGMSELIDHFEAPKPTPNSNSTPNSTTKPTLNSTPNSNSNGKPEVGETSEVSEVSEEDNARLKEIDALFNECLARATNTVLRRLGRTERLQAATYTEACIVVAKTYFEEVEKVRKGGERG